MFEAAIHGYLVSLSLILAIGAQNAFVLRQGLRREHVGVVVLACAISDALLIALGVTGFGAVSTMVPWIGEAMRWGGVLFLLVYGGLRFKAALAGGRGFETRQRRDNQCVESADHGAGADLGQSACLSRYRCAAGLDLGAVSGASLGVWGGGGVRQL